MRALRQNTAGMEVHVPGRQTNRPTENHMPKGPGKIRPHGQPDIGPVKPVAAYVPNEQDTVSNDKRRDHGKQA